MSHDSGVFQCDECPDYFDSQEPHDFTLAKTFAKRNGWRTFKGPDGKWADACPSCVAKFAEARRR